MPESLVQAQQLLLLDHAPRRLIQQLLQKLAGTMSQVTQVPNLHYWKAGA